jgi:hypothetical protein
MFRFRFVVGLCLLLAFSACGGGGGGAESGGSPPPATVRTLAYAVSQCREDATRFVAQQELRIREGEGAPVTVALASLIAAQEPPVLPGTCFLFGTGRFGFIAAFAGGIQRMAVSPDGSGVVFERTNRFSAIGYPPLPPDEEGFFFVRADASGLRPLGPASREPITRVVFDGSPPNGFQTNFDDNPLSFSADGRTVVFTDRGPGPAGEDAVQVATLDLATGARRQVTHLPQPTLPPDPLRFDVTSVRFLPDGRIVFFTDADADGLHPEGGGFTVRPDGTDIKEVPPPVVLAGSRIVEDFQITGDQVTAFGLDLPGGIVEIFLSDHGNLLQLTNFGRGDTANKTVDVDGQHVIFAASADPFGTNPTENCQIFSISTQGTDLRQLTAFSQGGDSMLGCGGFGGGGPPPGCMTRNPRQDPFTRAVAFESSCDPFGRNPNGEQVFAMREDGTGMEQLTDTSGFTTEADGTVDVELPGPFASTAVRR